MNSVLFAPDERPDDWPGASPDEWRADCADRDGDPIARVPRRGARAAASTRFDRCQAQHLVSPPSRASFMTGWRPRVRGRGPLRHLPRPNAPAPPRYRTRAGHDVGWHSKNDMLAPASFATGATDAGTPTAPPGMASAGHGRARRDLPRQHVPAA